MSVQAERIRKLALRSISDTEKLLEALAIVVEELDELLDELRRKR